MSDGVGCWLPAHRWMARPSPASAAMMRSMCPGIRLVRDGRSCCRPGSRRPSAQPFRRLGRRCCHARSSARAGRSRLRGIAGGRVRVRRPARAGGWCCALGGPAAGTMYQEVRLTNHSGLPCTLSGGPSAVTGVRADGSLVTLTSVAPGNGWNLIGPGPANLRPGRSGWVTLAYADGCPALINGGRAGYRTLLIALGGGEVRVDFTAALNLICGLLVSDFGAPAAPPPGSASPLNVLAAIVRLPATLTAGTTASYSVTA